MIVIITMKIIPMSVINYYHDSDWSYYYCHSSYHDDYHYRWSKLNISTLCNMCIIIIKRFLLRCSNVF